MTVAQTSARQAARRELELRVVKAVLCPLEWLMKGLLIVEVHETLMCCATIHASSTRYPVRMVGILEL